MRTLVAALMLALLAGCNATIGPKGIRGGGDSDQEVLTIDGKGTVLLDPSSGRWLARCDSDKCSLKWITQAQSNAQRDVQLVEAAGELAIKAMKAAAPVP